LASVLGKHQGTWLTAIGCVNELFNARKMATSLALQIALDFVFIAILLASFVGQAANAGPDQSSK